MHTWEFADVVEVGINSRARVSVRMEGVSMVRQQDLRTDLRNSMRVLLVKTMLVLSQSSIPAVNMSTFHEELC